MDTQSGWCAATTSASTEGRARSWPTTPRRTLQTTLEAQLGAEEKELFSFMGARCHRMTVAVMNALQLGRNP